MLRIAIEFTLTAVVGAAGELVMEAVGTIWRQVYSMPQHVYIFNYYQ